MFTIGVENKGGHKLISLSGELGHFSRSAFAEKLPTDVNCDLLIDVSLVRIADSYFLAPLVSCLHRATKAGHKIVVCGCNDKVRASFRELNTGQDHFMFVKKMETAKTLVS